MAKLYRAARAEGAADASDSGPRRTEEEAGRPAGAAQAAGVIRLQSLGLGKHKEGRHKLPALFLSRIDFNALTFSIWIALGRWRVHPHLFFELLAYVVAGVFYWRGRRLCGDHVSTESRWALAAAAVVGAVIGSRMLFWFEDPQRTVTELADFQYLAGGQTIVGGLIGGSIGVEWQKRRIGIGEPTGDLFAIPIALGTAIGRIGCFLSGLPDGTTYGLPSSVPWAINLGDGIPRHPTALYERGNPDPSAHLTIHRPGVPS